MGAQRGVALVLVMWLVALLAALVGAYATTARIEYMQGRVLHGAVAAESAARAGLEYALVRLQDPEPGRAWLADGRAYRWRFAGADVELRIVDESAKIDLNAADLTLLAGLFRALGAEPSQADAVAAAIVDWRDDDALTQPAGGAEDGQYAAAGLPYGAKDAPFDTIAEVEQVLGMTPALYALAAPHLSVFSGLEQPDQRFASAEVLTALGVDPAMMLATRESGGAAQAESLLGGGSGTYSIDSRARLADGRQAVLRAVIRVGGSGVPGSAYTPLRWEEGATPR
ncbi:type II secretion system protein GspK [Luteimonas sp. MC1825]|uniref:general secretion pathway protein GspK n=1 Tax=Luteimonas sp. MC1825 TaxID=2761107 RepID=UPI001621CF25|nr:type II secretion system protein GspK [Luteimonas sp. MC1825]MBB6600055.1 general secretion pathway protein GspK [Luteimonas sp. MC1825]QOC87757.1 general secretion pathway protein GspK [Luteimonas sp. MC1825]